MEKWNEDQLRVLKALEGNVIVSASAGSGKTAVMLERVMRLLREGTELKKIVILTFNTSIAEELKGKLYNAILNEIVLSNSKFMCDQLDEFPLATICTTDSFCMQLIKEYFFKLNLDPCVIIMNETEQQKQLYNTIEKQISKLLEKREGWLVKLHSKFIDTATLANQIKNIYNYVVVQPNRDEWLNNIAGGLYSVELKESKLINLILKLVINRGKELLEIIDERDMSIPAGSARDSLTQIIDLVKACINATNYNDLNLIAKIGFNYKKISNRKKEAWQEDYSYCFYAVKDYILWISEIASASYQSAEEAHLKSKRDVESLIDLTRLSMKEYENYKLKKSILDFSDLSYFAIKLLENNELAAEIRAKYDYICVDEYQDTNYVQEYIFNKISNGSNLFMVGDSKQSIYKFRLAEPDILINKFNLINSDIKNGEAIHLNYNYRSDKMVLDFINNIFDVIMSVNFGGVNYKSTERLIAGADFKKSNALPAAEINLFYKEKSDEEKNKVLFSQVYSVKEDNFVAEKISPSYSEGKYIADKIMEILKGNIKIFDLKLKSERRVTLNDFAIIAKSRSNNVQNIIKAIKDSGIPIDGNTLSKESGNLDIEILVDALKIIDNDKQDIPLYSLLKGPFFKFNDQTLADIRSEHTKTDYYYEACQKSLKLTRFYELLKDWKLKAIYFNVYEMLNMLFYEYGYEKYLLKENDGQARKKAVTSFIENTKNEDNLSSFLHSYENDSSVYNSRVDNICGYECVKTSTIHKCKGLEYPIVFLVDISNSLGRGDFTKPVYVECNKDVGISINYFDEENRIKVDNLTYQFMQELRKDDERAETMRLFYVALTRAQNHLFISGVCLSENLSEKRDYKINSMYGWIQNVAVKNPKIKEMINFHKVSESIIPINENSRTPIMKPEKNYPIIKNYLDFQYPYKKSTTLSIKFSVTEINQMQVYEDEISIEYAEKEEDKDINLVKRGVNYHAILEHINFYADTHAKLDEEIKRLIKAGILDSSQLKDINYQEILDILNSDVIKLAKCGNIMREREFMLRTRACDVWETDITDEILIQGAVDLIIDGEKLIVVDFKKSMKSEHEIKKTYKKQLDIYAMAVQEALGKTVAEKIIYVIGKNQIIKL